MDLLTHLFVPLTAAYVLQRELFQRHGAWLLGLGGFGVLADFDKFLGMPGLLHSLVTLVPLCLAVGVVEYRIRGRLTYSPLVVGLILSHLVLDFVDGGPVPLLFPFARAGIGLEYPAQVLFGSGPLGFQVEGQLVALRTTAPGPGFNSYGFLQGAGVVSTLLFGFVYLSDQVGRWATTDETQGTDETEDPFA